MKWIEVVSGISPESNTILVIREDDSIIVASKHNQDNAFGFSFLDNNGNDIMKQSPPKYFMDIWLPNEEENSFKNTPLDARV
jgi:hypothetical protein